MPIQIVPNIRQDRVMGKRLLRDPHVHLPAEFHQPHELCFVLHDIMAKSLVAGEEGDFFRTSIEVPPEVEELFTEDVGAMFRWLEAEGRFDDRAAIVLTTVFPAVLSDMLHCIYEGLQSSRKAKLNITYMLLRKPLQESLFLLESIVLSRVDFTAKLATQPLTLRAANAGGHQAHTKRIQRVLEALDETHRFDASYLAQLRYVKCDDGFDGVCNHAMHLFTEHKDIATGPMNINFVFSGWEQKLSQWAFLYSRLPYVLAYMLRVVEHLTKDFAQTDPSYLDLVDRQVAAQSVLAWALIDPHYENELLQAHVDANYQWLVEHCVATCAREPSLEDLARIARNGALPGESWLAVKWRHWRFDWRARLNRWEAERRTRRRKER
ncbi:hypothetical protein J2W30_006899 [Variovorax boronicumulans]|uniref:hypothetical protein n=1 Tax=Variovorax boronicumulans TaxID=436515 RepID=UPI00277E4344|nr:hypothetical protein [Variovorax boronicumulans]MDQ0039106.1 hypothetical protein [Variovorax boronicumulans]MDQ0045713.1 hypothetical protein [Variovorax boronicumulans]